MMLNSFGEMFSFFEPRSLVIGRSIRSHKLCLFLPENRFHLLTEIQLPIDIPMCGECSSNVLAIRIIYPCVGKYSRNVLAIRIQ
jgi:hypothetical protein